jgi:hypothetical protein
MIKFECHRNGKVFITEFTPSFSTGFNKYNENLPEAVRQERDELNKERSARQARKTIREICYNNFDSQTSFMTLTYKENKTDLKSAYYDLKKFIKRLEYKFKLDIKYLAVPELQERGAIHFHLILFSVPKFPLKELAKIWEHGFLKINKVKNSEHLFNYLLKYISKDINQKKLNSQKRFVSSRNLKKGLHYSSDNPNEIFYIASKLSGKKVFEAITDDYIFWIYEDRKFFNFLSEYLKSRIFERAQIFDENIKEDYKNENSKSNIPQCVFNF